MAKRSAFHLMIFVGTSIFWQTLFIFRWKTIILKLWTDSNTPSIALELQAFASKLFRWFKNNYVKANTGKSHIILSSKRPEIVWIDEFSLTASYHEELLGVTIDSELKFESHITELCQKSYKLVKNLMLSAVCQVPCHRKNAEH